MTKQEKETLRLVKLSIQKQAETIKFLHVSAENPQVAELISNAKGRQEVLEAVRDCLEGNRINLLLYT